MKKTQHRLLRSSVLVTGVVAALFLAGCANAAPATTTEDGKTVKKVYVESKDAQGAIVKKELPEFVKASPVWQGYLPALQSDGTSNGPEWLEQSPAGGSVGSKTSVLQDHIKQRNAQAASKGNALVPPPAPPVQTPLAT